MPREEAFLKLQAQICRSRGGSIAKLINQLGLSHVIAHRLPGAKENQGRIDQSAVGENQFSVTKQLLMTEAFDASVLENRAVCIDGSRACPPEDCGGIPGYEDMLKALGEKLHPEHRAMKQRLGRPFDPEAFSVDETHWFLAKIPWPKVRVPQLGKILTALHRAKT